MDIARRLFRDYASQNQYLENNKFQPNVVAPDQQYAQKSMNKSSYAEKTVPIVNWINHFCAYEGLELMNNLMKWSMKSQTTQDQTYKLPFNIMNKLLCLYQGLSEYLIPKYKSIIQEDVKKIVFSRVKGIPVKDLKDLDVYWTLEVVR